MIGLIIGGGVLYLIYFLFEQTLKIISNLFNERSAKDDLMNEYKKDNKDI